jgi:hypothetical protein
MALSLTQGILKIFLPYPELRGLAGNELRTIKWAWAGLVQRARFDYEMPWPIIWRKHSRVGHPFAYIC